MEQRKLLLRKLNALRLEVAGSIVDSIMETAIAALDESVQPSPWIAVSDQKPTEADANSEGEVWGIYVANTKKPFVMEVAASLVSEHPAMWSHWCPKESKPPLPAAPQPPSDL